MSTSKQPLKKAPEEMVTCNECGWMGYEGDLRVVIHHIDQEFCKACPECEVDDNLMDIKVEIDTGID